MQVTGMDVAEFVQEGTIKEVKLSTMSANVMYA